jgi:hypothetical protein
MVPATLLATSGGLPASITRQRGQGFQRLMMPAALLAAGGSLPSAIARNSLAILDIGLVPDLVAWAGAFPALTSGKLGTSLQPPIDTRGNLNLLGGSPDVGATRLCRDRKKHSKYGYRKRSHFVFSPSLWVWRARL